MGTQTFAPSSDAELRQRHEPPDGQSESVKHSSYEHPPGPTSPPNGKQRPSAPLVQSESLAHPFTSEPEYGCVAGPGARVAGQQAAAARW